MHYVVYNNKLEYKCTLTPLDPRHALYRPTHVKGHLSFRDTCLNSYSCLSVLCVLCLAACLTAVYTMQCWSASNAHYTVVGSFQRALCSFSHRIYSICTIFRSYLSKLYSIATYLGHQIKIFDFIYTKIFIVS